MDVQLVVLSTSVLSLDDILLQDLRNTLRVLNALCCFNSARLKSSVLGEAFAGDFSG